MKAVGKYIVIDPIKEVDTTTKGGLILAEKQREDIRYAEKQREDIRYRRAKVVEPGSDVSVLKKGDEVYYDKSAGFNIEINKENYKVIKEFDVVVIL
jgi:co-chaperonin GroES (HSP10)